MARKGLERTSFGGARTKIVLVVVAALGALIMAGNAFAGGPTVVSDQADYAPGSTVTLTGAGWGVGESVHVTVDDTLGQSWSWASNPDPLAGIDGSFTVTLTLPNTFIANYTVRAVGSSGASATATFTDGNVSSVSGTVTDSVTQSAVAGATLTCDTSGGCNATLTTTTDASGNYSFSSGNKLTFAGNGPTTLTLSVSKSGYATGTIVLSNVSNSDTFTNKNVALTPSKVDQSALSITGPASATFDAADQAITTTGGSGTGAITFSAGTSTACSIVAAKLHVSSGTGTCSITATKAGDANYNPTTSASFAVTINKASQTINFTSTAPSSATVGSTYQPAATGGGSGSPVTFGATGACSYNGATQLVTMSSVGNCTVTADQLGNGNYTAAAQQSQTFSVGKGNQTIGVTINAPTSAAYNGQFTVAATATSGLPVAYTSAGSCSNSGATFTMTSGSDTCTVKYDQAGDSNWNAAAQVTETVTASKLPQTITFTALDDKTYGDPAFEVTATGGASGNPVTFAAIGKCASGGTNGAMITLTGAGSCTVTADQAGDANYAAAASVPQGFQIGKASPTCSVSGYSTTYDGAAHTATGSCTGVGGASLDGLDLSMTTHTDAGDYTADPWSFAETADYNATSGTVHDQVAKKSVLVTFASSDKVYDGSADAALHDAALSGVLTADQGDVGLSGGSASFADKNVGQGKTVTASGFSLTGSQAGNYELGAGPWTTTASITKKPITVTPTAAQSKVYGDNDPTLTFDSSPDLISGDSFTGKLGRAAGEDVGAYAINLGSLSAGTNYDLSLPSTSVNFVITKRPVEVTADATTKVYGNPDPALTYAVTSGSVVGGDGFSGSLTRDAGETVAGGPYAIRQGTLTLGDNYSLSYVGANLTITRRPVQVTADPQTKVYGDADPALTYAVTSGSVVGGDGFSGSLTRDAGETVAGGPYPIRQGTLTLGDNYSLSYVGANLAITRAPLSVVVADTAKVLNAPLPALTGTVSGIKFSDNITATYSTTATAGSPVGTYPITAMLVDPDNKLPNYNPTSIPGTLTITYASSGTCGGAAGHAILQPVNVDGTSVFKQGSTVPAKFRVCDANGASIGTAGVVSDFKLVQRSTGTESTTVNETVDSTTPDTAFRWSSTDQQWIYNISTKSLAKNATHVYAITLNDGSKIQFQFGLR